ncbi:hypothetical protein HW44_13060 [Nitrosococcus oceani]|nr:hypothetical protein HW44_13060 [Nitrosococcus oceani]
MISNIKNNQVLTSIIIPCYRNTEGAIRAVHALVKVLGDSSQDVEIIVVDDGSGDGSAANITAATAGEAHVVGLEKNSGRSTACNAGAKYASGEYIVFMDCDCVPLTNIAQQHARQFAGGVVASAGVVEGSGDNGFWDDYQRLVSRRRARMYKRGFSFSSSSVNLAIRRRDFIAVGGFDQSYNRYGFEDRDLLIRLSRRGRISLTNKAIVRHMDKLTLVSICDKMAETGRYSSGRFRQKFQDEYSALGYEAVDVDNKKRPWLRGVAWLTSAMIKPAAYTFDMLEHRFRLPLWLGAPVVRLLSGLAYLNGTALRE